MSGTRPKAKGTRINIINGTRRTAHGTRLKELVFIAAEKVLRKCFILNSELQTLSVEPCLSSVAPKAKGEALSLCAKLNN